MNKKEILFIGSLILGTLTFAGGDLSLSTDIPLCEKKLAAKYEKDQKNKVREIINEIAENERLIEVEYNKDEKNWDEIERLTKIGGELKGELEYIILARN